MTHGTLHRLSAFADGGSGGNPAGVWVGETLPDPETMLRIAAEVGFSETAFVAPVAGTDRKVRYFSPEVRRLGLSWRRPLPIHAMGWAWALSSR